MRSSLQLQASEVELEELWKPERSPRQTCLNKGGLAA